MTETTKVQLAYPYKSHKADDVVELPEDEARQLLRDGRARDAGRKQVTGAHKTDSKSSASSASQTRDTDDQEQEP